MADAIKMTVTENASDGLALFAAKVSEEYLFSAAAAMAKVVYDEVVLNVTVEGRQGIGRVTGNLAGSVYRANVPEQTSGEKVTYRVSWNKKKAPHGHLLEFGTAHMAARPFIRPALSSLDQAIDAGKARLAARIGGAA